MTGIFYAVTRGRGGMDIKIRISVEDWPNMVYLNFLPYNLFFRLKKGPTPKIRIIMFCIVILKLAFLLTFNVLGSCLKVKESWWRRSRTFVCVCVYERMRSCVYECACICVCVPWCGCGGEPWSNILSASKGHWFPHCCGLYLKH